MNLFTISFSLIVACFGTLCAAAFASMCGMKNKRCFDSFGGFIFTTGALGHTLVVLAWCISPWGGFHEAFCTVSVGLAAGIVLNPFDRNLKVAEVFTFACAAVALTADIVLRCPQNI